jgi:hypothetical protein
MSNFFSLNLLTASKTKSLGRISKSASRNKRISPLAIFAPQFLPFAGSPPFVIIQL